jgi:hypothetical protein
MLGFNEVALKVGEIHGHVIDSALLTDEGLYNSIL